MRQEWEFFRAIDIHAFPVEIIEKKRHELWVQEKKKSFSSSSPRIDLSFVKKKIKKK